jgi:signal transduction histidine kinase
MRSNLLVVGVRTDENGSWIISRVRAPHPENVLLTPIVVQTLLIYVVVMAAVALILRRITRPLAALTRRLERFAAKQDLEGQLAPSGPEDMQHLIVAHNAMESRIAALLDEKNVMLGAIGHDLKTPLAALRVRIESVSDDVERARMAATIEDIVHTLDDILSLARVGRPSDPLERTELSALMFSVIEEYEDMGEPVEVGETERIALELRPTWIRRALRNLIGNALRYGERARVSLSREGDRAVILIADDGPGIPDDSINAMMNPFTRGDPSRNSATGGAGLGLALARAIADQHGGALVLANRVSADGTVEGLTARLELPVA